MNRFYIFILVILLMPSSLMAQLLNSRVRHNQSVYVKAYTDSLRNYRQVLDNAMTDEEASRAFALDRKRPESYPMITPLTYFKGVAQRSFALEAENDAQQQYDNSMAAMYLHRPDLVKDSESKIMDTGAPIVTPVQPMRPEVSFTEHEEAGDVIIVDAPDANDDVELVNVKPNFWKFNGDYSLQFLQNYVSDNWYKGGESNYAMIGGVVLQMNYNDKDRIKFDNKLEMKLGMQSSQGDTIHNFKSSEDLIRLTSKLGVQATKKWYYTLQLLAETQFTHGYKSNDSFVYSDFMSPFKLNLSLGMDYKVEWCNKHLTGTINISPLAANYKYYNRLNLAAKAGYAEGRHAKWDFGSTFTADLEWKFSDLVKWQTRLYAYTTYHRTEVEWENTVTFQLSKYISTKVFVYPRFDDSVKSRNDKYGYFQLKEYWSLGFNYTM